MLDEWKVELGTDGTDYLATWIRYGESPLETGKIIARRIPAVGAPRTANGYRMFYRGSTEDGVDSTWDVRIDSDGTVSRMRVADADAIALARIGRLVHAGADHLVVSEVGSINFEEIELRVIADSGAIVKGPAKLERKSETNLDVAHGFGIVYDLMLVFGRSP